MKNLWRPFLEAGLYAELWEMIDEYVERCEGELSINAAVASRRRTLASMEEAIDRKVRSIAEERAQQTLRSFATRYVGADMPAALLRHVVVKRTATRRSKPRKRK